MDCPKCGLDNEGVIRVCVDCGWVFGAPYQCPFGKEYELALRSVRFGARVFDTILSSVPLWLILTAGWETASLVVSFCFTIPYFYFADGFRGQSLGKRFFRIIVIDSISGEPCGFGMSFARNFLLHLTVIDCVFALFSKANQRLGDRCAGTVVVKRTWDGVKAPLKSGENVALG